MNECTAMFVLGEVGENRAISRLTQELLGLGRRLADEIPAELSVVFIGENVRAAAGDSLCCGADRAYVIEDSILSHYDPDLYSGALEKLCEEKRPFALLAGHTSLGQDLLPRVAAGLATQVVTDCVNLATDNATDELLMTKPVFGGNALAVFSCASRPQMATIRPRLGKPLDRTADRSGQPIAVDLRRPDASEVRTRVIKRIEEKTDDIKLEDAEIVVCGGRGIGSSEGFDRLRDLAGLLGAAVGASRPPCDMGWIESSSQVGLTGKIVAPKIYIAVALSGAMQHLTGMSEAKHMVAINSDPDANIFKVADYGVIGDYREVLPPFVEKMKELLGDHV